MTREQLDRLAIGDVVRCRFMGKYRACVVIGKRRSAVVVESEHQLHRRASPSTRIVHFASVDLASKILEGSA